MSKYTYEAYSKDSKIETGVYEASSRQDVVDYLTKKSLTPVSIWSNDDSHKREGGILSIQIFSSISGVDIMFFVRNLATTIKAGLSIVESLDILIKDTKNKYFKKILQDVLEKVKGGQQISMAFQEYEHLFPSIFIGMIKAGEVSGQLDRALSELSHYLSKEYELRNKIKSAMTYPIILLVASTIVVTLMLIFVLPKLTQSFATNGVKLPLITQIFLNISNALTYSYIIDGFVLVAIIFFFTYFRTTKIGKKLFFFVTSHTPVAKDLIKKIALVRFARTFGNLIGSGLSVVDSLNISAQSINNQDYTEAINKTIEDIKNGLPISESIAKFPKLFPGLLISLISVGERTGALQEILITFADFYDEEVDNTLKQLTSLLEPILLLTMGLMIGAIAISIILPIYSLVGHFV